jgi:hypothetical protein
LQFSELIRGLYNFVSDLVCHTGDWYGHMCRMVAKVTVGFLFSFPFVREMIKNTDISDFSYVDNSVRADGTVQTCPYQ